MISIAAHYENVHKEDYERAHEFARKKYLEPTINMQLHSRPSILVSAKKNDGSIFGVIGINIDRVAHEMLAKDERIKHFMDRQDACDQNVFALENNRSFAPLALTAAIGVLAKNHGRKYMGILAIPVSRKIISSLGVEPLKSDNEDLGFGTPDIGLVPPKNRAGVETWFINNQPTSLEIVDLDQAHDPCASLLKKMKETGRIALCPNLSKMIS